MELGGLDVRAVELDVTSETSVRNTATLVDAVYGRLDLLVNNAGIGGPRMPTLEMGAAVAHPLSPRQGLCAPAVQLQSGDDARPLQQSEHEEI